MPADPGPDKSGLGFFVAPGGGFSGHAGKLTFSNTGDTMLRAW